MSETDVASANRHAARLVGTHVYQFRVANALTLDFQTGDVLIVETPVVATSAAGTWQGHPTDGGGVDVLFPLLYLPVESARVLLDGTLRLTFGDGSIEIAPHPAYESWQLATQERSLVVCTPGGGLALWT